LIGASPLHIAAQYNRPNIAKLLIEYGADINQKSQRDGNTALFMAMRSSRVRSKFDSLENVDWEN
jgi:ankyrin repeat protein